MRSKNYFAVKAHFYASMGCWGDARWCYRQHWIQTGILVPRRDGKDIVGRL